MIMSHKKLIIWFYMLKIKIIDIFILKCIQNQRTVLFGVDICLGLCRNISDVLWEAISTGQVISLYQGLGTKNLQSFISQFIYFYGYSFFKRLYLQKSGSKTIGTKVNLIVAAAAGACTVIITQVVIFWVFIYLCYYQNTIFIF